MRSLTATALSLSLLALDLPAEEKSMLIINPNGSQPSAKGAADYFTGTVRVDAPFKGTQDARVSGATVTFEPGARTAWHTPSWTNLDCHGGCRPGAGAGTTGSLNQTGRYRVDSTPCKTLAWRDCHHRDDSYRHCRSSGHQGRRLDGAGQ